jgi:hypothetical protein
MTPGQVHDPATEMLPVTRHFIADVFLPCPQNAMPLSAAIFKSEEKNPTPQCPPRLDVQTIQPVLWSRMPSSFLKVETERVSERHGWVVQCLEPLQMMALHIPEENRYWRGPQRRGHYWEARKLQRGTMSFCSGP